MRPPRYICAYTHTHHPSSVHTPTQPCPVIYPSTHLSIFLSVAPLICCPVIISQPSKARQSLLSQSAILHFAIADTIFRTPLHKIKILCIFTPSRGNHPPTHTLTRLLGRVCAFNLSALTRHEARCMYFVFMFCSDLPSEHSCILSLRLRGKRCMARRSC